MEELSTVASSGWRSFTQNKAICCCATFTILTLFGVFLTFLIYLGVYSFNNPDQDVWLAHMS